MANVITTNPITVDTTGALSVTGLKVRTMVWTSIEGSLLAATNDLIIRGNGSSTGPLLFNLRLQGTPENITIEFPGQDGWKIAGDIHVTIDAGLLQLFLV